MNNSSKNLLKGLGPPPLLFVDAAAAAPAAAAVDAPPPVVVTAAATPAVVAAAATVFGLLTVWLILRLSRSFALGCPWRDACTF